ncbi:Phage portal protein, lambda family [Aquimixticola soesokkakensis]|uniref:Phage portal protein, lambda family n=1 Tax=Aquimixticola soesokkakensis TaxID=1519096 RepID=A0A1Y5SB93_9RHOB|nr:phage portal protein [Aquimixticola soesokkakensis]SLN35643.1 Phage portal protein, lambda family [Aquimixticola soesokkakensis]
MKLIDLFKRNSAPMQTRRFDGAAGGRRWSSAPSFGRTGPETLAASAPIRSRARYFVANNPWAANGVSALVSGLVGFGIKPASQHPDAGNRASIGAAFATWAKRADAEGRTDLFGLQANAARAMIVDGEAFLHIETRANGLRLRLLPAEMVDEADTRDLPNGGYVVAGIEFNAAGQRVAYHVLKARPTAVSASTYGTIRVPAEDMLHLVHPLGAGQVRGVSWLAPILLRLSELDQLEDALAVGVKTAAMFAGFLVDQNGTGEPFDASDESGILTRGLEPGVLQRLPSGFDIRFSTPQQAQQTAEFVSHQIRAIAAGLGVPAHLVSGDLREANYGSLRAGMVAFRQKLEQIQFGTVIPQMCAPIWERAVSALILRGDLAATDFEAAAPLWLAAEHYPPPMPWIDPAKDVAAIRDALEGGLMSRRQAVAERGYDVETLDSEIAADREREARLGINFNPRAATPEPQKEAGSE